VLARLLIILLLLADVLQSTLHPSSLRPPTQSNAETCVREMLFDFATRLGMGPEGGVVYSVDTMDDGTEIRLKLSIDKTTRTAVFDFGGSGPQVLGPSSPTLLAHSLAPPHHTLAHHTLAHHTLTHHPYCRC
jgi:hypothetical protein